MKWLVAALLFLLSTPTWAVDGCREEHFGLITVSKHLDPSRRYNESHWGPYWRCQLSEMWSGQVGWYPNSYNRSTLYGMVSYVPWRWRLAPLDTTLKLGGSAGLGTGYAEHSNGTPKNGLSLVAGGVLAVEVNDRAHVGLFFNTAVVALVAEMRWR